MKSTTQPFRVICKLVDGRINSADGLLRLDCILYHAWFAKYEPEVFLDGKIDRDIGHIGVPLRQMERDMYAASCGFYHQYSQRIEYWNKRTDQLTFADKTTAKGKINLVSGEYKAYHMPQVIRTVGDIEFYGYGTISKVQDLLAYIPAVGKKPAAGWGAVKEWIVEPFDEDWSVTGKYGLMRPMPVGMYTPDRDYAITEHALCPPAWKSENMALCYTPEVQI